jgi:hypothetical protein
MCSPVAHAVSLVSCTRGAALDAYPVEERLQQVGLEIVHGANGGRLHDRASCRAVRVWEQE